MAFSLSALIWDDRNEDHIAQHSITREEVEEVCFGDPWITRAKGRDRRAVYGQSDAGRYLVIVVARRGSGRYYPITAREMTQGERRRFLQVKR